MNYVVGKYCGRTKKNGILYNVYISRNHFCLVKENKFIQYISKKELKKLNIVDSKGKIIYNKNGYIGPKQSKEEEE